MPLPPLPRPYPSRLRLAGRYAALEPLDAARHAGDLFTASYAPGAAERFRYLAASDDPSTFPDWLTAAAASEDPMFHAVIDLATGRCGGRQALLRIAPEHGVAEVGHILWGPGVARTRVATEALYLAARYVFEGLGYRRLEWKCDAANAASVRSARRFGFTFEGVFRHHLVVKGRSRDTAWFAILDQEWPSLAASFEAWLAPSNFDDAGRQVTKLRVARG
jgi:RimJ/RimL family protein N-acetyltransferase